jgi:hypothetical protein
MHETTVLARLDVAQLVMIGQDPAKRVGLDRIGSLGEQVLAVDRSSDLVVSGVDLSLEMVRNVIVTHTIPLPLELLNALGGVSSCRASDAQSVSERARAFEHSAERE